MRAGHRPAVSPVPPASFLHRHTDRKGPVCDTDHTSVKGSSQDKTNASLSFIGFAGIKMEGKKIVSGKNETIVFYLLILFYSFAADWKPNPERED
jgi:hypothetical protein